MQAYCFRSYFLLVTVIIFAGMVSWAEQKPAWICGRNISKTDRGPGKSVGNTWKIHLLAGFWFVVCCCQSWWLHWPAVVKHVRRPYWAGVLALPGTMGHCASAHIFHSLECPGAVWATQRPFLLPYQEGARGSHEGSAVQALAQGVCADLKLDQAVVSLLI